MRELVLVSGGFDPIHSGHIYLIQEASKYGDVIEVNSWISEWRAKTMIASHEIYNNGQLYDVQKDAMEKKPIKNVTGPLIKQREALQSAFTQIEYPNIK